jgi:hypothetical protein
MPTGDFAPDPYAWGIALILAGAGFWRLAPAEVRADEALSRRRWGRWSWFHRWPTATRRVAVTITRLQAVGCVVVGIVCLVTGSIPS